MRVFPFAPLRHSGKTYDIIAFDTEDNGQGAPDNFICASFYGRVGNDDISHTFFSRDQARKFLFKKWKRPVLIFAHNLAYDLVNLDYPEGDANIIPSKNGRLIGARITHGNGKKRIKINLMDTGNFFIGASIDSLGSLIGHPKIDFDFRLIRNKHPEDLDYDIREKVSAYCMRDAEICYKIAVNLQQLVNKYHTKLKSYTAASLALRIFRTNFMDFELWPRSMEINDFERKAYYGGRTEVFDYRKFPFPVYEDINSSYPSAMFDKMIPHPQRSMFMKNKQWDEIRDSEGISIVDVSVPKMHVPPLPYRTETGKLLFPTGRWTAAYTHPELRMAEKYGARILHVHESLIYRRTFSPFRRYIETIHELKSRSNGIERGFYKLLLNSLSGKFGEIRHETIRVNYKKAKLCRCSMPSGVICQKCGNFNMRGIKISNIDGDWISMIGNRLPDPTHTYPVMIAYIASYGRIKLYEERLSKVLNPIYCDTDCCVCLKSNYINSGDELGQWSEEKISDFQAFAPKFYLCSGKMKLKGVPKNHVVRENGNSLTFFYQKPLKLAEAIHQKSRPNLWKEVEKVVTYEDSKRIKLKNGKSDPVDISF